MGEDAVKLRSNYDDLVKILKDNWTIIGGYVQMLWMLSIGIMLDTDERNMRILSNMIDNENVSDALYDFLIKYRLTDWERCSDTVLFPVPYQSTLSIISNNNQSKELALGITIINMVSYMTVIGALKAVHWSRSWGWMTAA